MYLLYFIALVILGVTGADNVDERCNYKEYPSFISAEIVKLIEGYEKECVAQKLNLNVIDMHVKLLEYIDKFPRDRILEETKQKNAITETNRIIETRIEDYLVSECATGINNFAETFFKNNAMGKWEESALSPFIVHASISLTAPWITTSTPGITRELVGYPYKKKIHNYMQYKTFIRNVNAINPGILRLKFKYFCLNLDSKFSCDIENPARNLFEADIQYFKCEKSCADVKTEILKWFSAQTLTSYETRDEVAQPKTKEEIALEDFVANIDKNSGVIFATAGHFHATFDKNFVADMELGAFLKYDSVDRQVNMRFTHAEGYFRHGELDEVGASFIEIPFEEIGPHSPIVMMIIRPNKVGGCAQLIKEFGKININELLGGDNVQRVYLRLPYVLSFRSDVTLVDALGRSQLGLEKPIFNSKAFEENLGEYVTMHHKTFVKVEYIDRPGSIPYPPRNPDEEVYDFTVNSTFIYAIILKNTVPVYLFVGRSD